MDAVECLKSTYQRIRWKLWRGLRRDTPARTLQSAVLKLIPNAETDDAGILKLRPCQIDTVVRDAALDGCDGYCMRCRRRYWLAEIKDTED